MAGNAQAEVARILEQFRAGEAGAEDRLIEAVAGELDRLAQAATRSEQSGYTLHPPDLVREAYQRLVGQDAGPDRKLFLGAAVEAVRRLLVQHARRRAQRGDGGGPLPLDEPLDHFARYQIDVLKVHDVLDQLTALNPGHARVLRFRYFGGFSLPEIADLLGMGEAEVERDYRTASAFLRSRLSEVS